MPHMMPMLWIMTYFLTLFFLMITISLLYFFFIPNMNLPKSKAPKKLYKWTWLW
uniref:ATP synthase F0 subunit 8 n=1 Tax=Polyrhachis dives TaxID=84555 RepID=A0A0A0S0Q9_9HYME|nr:ATP synthase F0 subunit 8 [Polyrhachis dives]